MADGPTFGDRRAKWTTFSELDVVVRWFGPLESVACQHCDATGTLVRDWNDKVRCPGCRETGMALVRRYIH